MSDEMPDNVDLHGGERGKYLARYRRWAEQAPVRWTITAGAEFILPVTTSGNTREA